MVDDNSTEEECVVYVTCDNPNHSRNIHLFRENDCGNLLNVEIIPLDGLHHTNGKTCVCIPQLDEDSHLIHNDFRRKEGWN